MKKSFLECVSLGMDYITRKNPSKILYKSQTVYVYNLKTRKVEIAKSKSEMIKDAMENEDDKILILLSNVSFAEMVQTYNFYEGEIECNALKMLAPLFQICFPAFTLPMVISIPQVENNCIPVLFISIDKDFASIDNDLFQFNGILMHEMGHIMNGDLDDEINRMMDRCKDFREGKLNIINASDTINFTTISTLEIEIAADRYIKETPFQFDIERMVDQIIEYRKKIGIPLSDEEIRNLKSSSNSRINYLNCL